MLPLLFSELLSYLVGMKRKTSKCVTSRETTLSFFVMYLSLLSSEVYLLVNLLLKLYVIFILQWIVFIFVRNKEEDQ